MKLRIKGNSIRLRLSQGDLLALKEKSVCKMETKFPAQQSFSYSLVIQDVASLAARKESNGIAVLFPRSEFDHWYETEMVGLENQIDLPSGERLQVLVEKDWQCMVPRHEDESDLFPNPNAEKSNA